MFSPVNRFPTVAAASSLRLPLTSAAGFVLLYVLLDWISYVHPMRGLNITPWNPQAALAVALLMWRPGSWWLVAATLAGTEVLVRGLPPSWAVHVVPTALLTLGYWVGAAAMRRWLGPVPHIATRKAFLIFLVISAGTAALTASLHIGALAMIDSASMRDRLLAGVLRAWIGDAVSLIVVLPVLFIMRSWERRAATAAMLRTLESWLVIGAAVAAAFAVFGQATEDQFKFFYLLFVPVVWSAARFGTLGAAWCAALVQVLLIVAVQSTQYRPLTVFELHMLLAALAATGLLLGTTVDEREEAQRALRASLHLAAAGDMAAALAHELNQPLTALSTYAHACQLLVRQQRGEGEHRGVDAIADPLADVTGKLVNEASRASNVVKRLRDFFRTRSTELQPVDVPMLIEEVIRSQSTQARALHVVLEGRCDEQLPRVWLDQVQIEVVLRNLVSNAMDAVAQHGAQPASVSVEARLRDGHLVVAVRDSGPGISAAMLPHLFESRPSTKPGGMGIGLAICRTIIEAHGGRLWAEVGAGGRFFFSIPSSTASPHE
ncbi:two-component system, LuxR family, sensor histidine kinase DctS [Burkholderiaceae bacterium]|nr:two-component system, LuxR family, sensor histidine kinase DctS [Burkholderiaceae bacterium]